MTPDAAAVPDGGGDSGLDPLALTAEAATVVTVAAVTDEDGPAAGALASGLAPDSPVSLSSVPEDPSALAPESPVNVADVPSADGLEVPSVPGEDDLPNQESIASNLGAPTDVPSTESLTPDASQVAGQAGVTDVPDVPSVPDVPDEDELKDGALSSATGVVSTPDASSLTPEVDVSTPDVPSTEGVPTSEEEAKSLAPSAPGAEDAVGLATANAPVDAGEVPGGQQATDGLIGLVPKPNDEDDDKKSGH